MQHAFVHFVAFVEMNSNGGTVATVEAALDWNAMQKIIRAVMAAGVHVQSLNLSCMFLFRFFVFGPATHGSSIGQGTTWGKRARLSRQTS